LKKSKRRLKRKMLFLLLIPIAACEPGDPTIPIFPLLTGPYLGQTPPGLTPVRFPPAALQASESWFWHGSPAFSPDGREMFFVKMINSSSGQRMEINAMKIEDDSWTEPHPAEFSDTAVDENNPVFSPDGNALYFISARAGGLAIFKTTREASGAWSSPQVVAIPLPPGWGLGWQLSIAADGTLYFDLWTSGGNPPSIYFSRPNGEAYETAQPVAAVINATYGAFSPCIAPDESFLIFVSNRPGCLGFHDLYVSFRNPDGSWGSPVGLGGGINSAEEDVAPALSPDGLYFFLTTVRTGDADFNPYWVSAEVIANLKSSASIRIEAAGSGTARLNVFQDEGVVDEYRLDARVEGTVAVESGNRLVFEKPLSLDLTFCLSLIETKPTIGAY
jgi:hypothetical protein